MRLTMAGILRQNSIKQHKNDGIQEKRLIKICQFARSEERIIQK